MLQLKARLFRFLQLPRTSNKTFSPGLSSAFPNHSSWTSVSPFPTPPSVSHAAVSTPPGQGPHLYHLSSRQLPSAPETPITTFWAQLWDVFVSIWFVCTFRWFLPHAVKIQKMGRLSRSRVLLETMFLLWYLNTSIHTYGCLKVNITHTAGIKYQDDIHLVRVCII